MRFTHLFLLLTVCGALRPSIARAQAGSVTADARGDEKYVVEILHAARPYIQIHQPGKAAEILANAVATQIAVSADLSRFTPIFAMLAEAYGDMKSWHNQEKTLGQLVEIWVIKAGPNSSIVAHYLLAQATSYEKDGDRVNAAAMERKAIAVLDELYGPDNLAASTALQKAEQWEGTEGDIVAPRLGDPLTAVKRQGFPHEERDATPPKLLSKVEPQYSEEARKARLEGVVLIKAWIAVTGSVEQIAIISPLGLGLDEEAIKAVKHWKFNPAVKDGQPAPVAATIEVNFHLL